MRLIFLMRAALALGVALLLSASGSAQITLGQKDTFEDGTLNKWTNGNNNVGGNLKNLTGGPGGASDRYLDVTSTGDFGTGSRLAFHNRVQWTGDYNAAGVNAIEMDLRNFGSSSLTIRVALRADPFSQLTSGYVSDPGFALANDGAWHHAVFSLTDSAMKPINSPSVSLHDSLSSVPEVRLLSSVNPSLNGDLIIARMGVDNIQASFQGGPAPEPASVLLICAAGLGTAAWVRRRFGKTSATATE
jgi:hypothetical protein